MWCFVGRTAPVKLLAYWIVDGKCSEVPWPSGAGGIIAGTSVGSTTNVCHWKKYFATSSTYEFKNISVPFIHDQTFGPYPSGGKKRKRPTVPLTPEEAERARTEEILSEVFDWFGLVALRLTRFLQPEKKQTSEDIIAFESSDQETSPLAELQPIEATIYNWRDRNTLPEFLLDPDHDQEDNKDFTGLGIGTEDEEENGKETKKKETKDGKYGYGAEATRPTTIGRVPSFFNTPETAKIGI